MFLPNSKNEYPIDFLQCQKSNLHCKIQEEMIKYTKDDTKKSSPKSIMIKSRITELKPLINDKLIADTPNFSFLNNPEIICRAKILSNCIDLNCQLPIQSNKEPMEINQDQPLPFSINNVHAISSGILMPNHGDGACSPNITLAIINENPENLEKEEDYTDKSTCEKSIQKSPYMNQNQTELNCNMIVKLILKESFANYSMINQAICLNVANGITSSGNEVNYVQHDAK